MHYGSNLKSQQSCVYKELHWQEMVVKELIDHKIVFVINDLKTKLMVL